MEKPNPNQKTNENIFDFYEKLKGILNEYESNLDKIDNEATIQNIDEDKNEIEINKIISLTLKKIIFAISCELSSYFMDNVFLISKLKFQNFNDNKSFGKVLEDILYQIVKQINIFSFRAIINLFETMQIGNFSIESMAFFIKVLLTFYYVHTRTLMRLPEGINKSQYEIIFKQNFSKGISDMISLIKIIPIIELSNNNDNNLIPIVLRIDDIPNNFQERPISNISTNSLPPIKTQKNKLLNKSQKENLNLFKNINTSSELGPICIPTPNYNNDDNASTNLDHSLTENFFTTDLRKK